MLYNGFTVHAQGVRRKGHGITFKQGQANVALPKSVQASPELKMFVTVP
jgi:hypothetical protein